MSNFQFLESHWTDLAKLGDLSEKYVYSDPNTSIIKQGILSEVMVKYMLAYDGIAEPAYDNTHANRIRILKNNDLLPREIDNTLYILRKARNDAAHNAADEGEKALNNLQLMYELCVWYMQTYGDYNYEPTGYVQPVDMTVSLADLEKENAELEERNQQLLIEIEQIQKNGGADIKRRTVAYQKAMATGTGKTRTVLGMIYRFLDAGRFKRILYLVDRTSLGDQTMDTFKEVKLKELLTLNQMYDVKSLEDKEFEKDTRVHIATVQSLVKRIMYNESDKSLGVSDYDLVIVDEAHRGYILDKEMGDDEVLYRDQNDFRSKYRAVIDYFDAVKIALTATPALHTTEIFGKPVYSYDYRTAVIDGFLVDHDAPHIIKTKLSEEGISFEKGSTVPIYDPVTNEITKVIKLYPDLIDDEYLYKYYFTQFYQDFCVKASKGRSAQAGFNRDDMNNIPFPLPPLAEQRRIVEQIEGLFSKLDEVKEKIECLLDSKKVRCNSVLNKAFTGKLTAKWRENNNIKFETWEYINFEKIIVEGPQNGMYKPKTSYGSGTKILRIDCFYDGKLEPWEKLKRLEITDEEKHTYLLSVNDIVVNRVNSMPYLGKSALIRKLPEQCVFESNMMRIKINIRKANPEYVIRYLNSSIGLQELRKNAKQAVNQASINQQDVKMVKIALPSLEEQNEIVKIITSISNKDEAILNKAEAVIEEIDLMKKSILAKAFRGELGTNISKEKNSIEVLKKLIEESK